MWRIFALASLIIAAGMAMWPAHGPRPATPAASSASEKCHLIEVMHYGGNLICHDRFESNVVGSGNNVMGLSRIEAMNKKRWVAEK